jgi:signal transduction histidine kinase
LLLWWVVLLSIQSHAVGSIMRFDAAEFVLDDATAPPEDTAHWKPQSLPDNWNLLRPGVGGNAWYRLRFELPHEHDELQAIYVRKLSMNAAFYVNGSFVGSGGRFEDPVARNWNRPQFVTIPPDLLKQGPNTLHVRLWAYPNSRGGLGEIDLGPEAKLRPAFERRHFLQTILPQLCNIIVAAAGLSAFAFWIRRRNESYYICFFVFTVLWALRSTHLFVRDIPVSAFCWDIWAQSSFGWCALLFIAFTMRYLGLRWPRFEVLMAIYAALGPILMYMGGPARLHAIANNWCFVIVPVAMFFEGFLIRQAWRSRALDDALLATVWALVIAASIHDGLVHRDRLAFDSFYLVSHVMILLFLAVAWHQANRFVRALNETEALNLELEQRVAQKHAELERNFERLQEVERLAAVADERRRLMSEMHDGIGSQLIATVDLVEHGNAARTEIAGELREALDGLRLTIDSLQPTEDDLLTVLGNLRYRLEGRLKRQGIALDWQVSDLPKLPSLTPQNVLHVLRILQEALTNIAKHAYASVVTVHTGFTEQHLFITITDDGRGFAAGHREGRGFESMRRRAQALGAKLAITPSAMGTALTLHLPRSL